MVEFGGTGETFGGIFSERERTNHTYGSATMTGAEIGVIQFDFRCPNELVMRSIISVSDQSQTLTYARVRSADRRAVVPLFAI